VPGVSVWSAQFYYAKPSSLMVGHFPRQPEETFFLLELARPGPSGVYRKKRAMEDAKDGHEELTELYPGRYASDSVFDNGYIDCPETGEPIALPPSRR
jgi:hypothetical protein